MGTKERRERERAEVRDKILDAARELFVHEGYEAVTMRKIAERIEYSPTAIYLHFKDKEAVLRELCDTDFLGLARQFAKIARVADPVERLRQTAQAYCEFGLDNPNHYRLMFMTPHPPMDKDDSRVDKGNPEEDAYAFLLGAVAEALAGGRFQAGLDDPDLIAQTLWAGLHGVIALEIAKANDPWCDWRSTTARSGLMSDVLLRGLLRNEEK